MTALAQRQSVMVHMALTNPWVLAVYALCYILSYLHFLRAMTP
jgi:hypothetical protein